MPRRRRQPPPGQRRDPITIALVGQPERIQRELEKHKTTGLNLPIISATQVIDMDDKPATAVCAKRDSSSELNILDKIENAILNDR